MSPSIFQPEYHNESIEKSPTALAPDQYLSGLRLAGIVDPSHDLEAEGLVLSVSYEGPISELGGRLKGSEERRRIHD